MSDHQPVNVADFERLAADRIEVGALGYFAGGAGDERTLRRNADAFGEWELIPRVLVDVSAVDSSIELFGSQLSMPLAQAPVAFQRLVHPDGEEAMARAVGAAGTAMCLSTIATATPASVAAAAPDTTKWFQLYVFSDRAVTEGPSWPRRSSRGTRRSSSLWTLRSRAGASGTCVRVSRWMSTPQASPRRSARTGPYRSRRFSAWSTPRSTGTTLLRSTAGCELPVVVKGLMHPADAGLAIEAGAAGVVVSNHGGRQLDGVPATIDALPAVAEAVAGRTPILVDGGIRRGTDVLIALALGADAVLTGRPALWGLAVDGEKGAAGGARDPQGRGQARASAAGLSDARGCHARLCRPGAKRLEPEQRGRPPRGGRLSRGQSASLK